MRTIKININNEKIYEHILFLLKNLKVEGLEVVEDKRSSFDETGFMDWDQREIADIGKIAFNSRTFVIDDEDYSRW